MIIVPQGLPASETMGVKTGDKSARIAILNLMPLKEDTERDLLRVLSYATRTIEVTLMRLSSHVSKHTSAEHLDRFYRFFSDMRDEDYDGLIITGAPVEHLEFEEVDYWREFGEIVEWGKRRVNSTLYLCWAAQAGLYYNHGVRKHPLPSKMFGVFEQTILRPELPLFERFDTSFNMPHSRHTEVRRADIEACEGLEIVAESDECGVSVVVGRDGRDVYVTGHIEYNPITLDSEYRRDLSRGLPISLPRHYYIDDNPERGPRVTWSAHGTLLYQNWINNYVCR